MLAGRATGWHGGTFSMDLRERAMARLAAGESTREVAAGEAELQKNSHRRGALQA
jgi:hypothetical protein